MSAPIKNNRDWVNTLYRRADREAIERWMRNSPVTADHDLEDANLVAELALCTVRDKLPQWWAMRSDGSLVLGRTPSLRLVSEIDTCLEPVFLGEINWADSGPGYSWPESYYAVALPGYDIVVVTASQDSIDAYGYADIAIGYFPATTDLIEGASRLVEGWWRAMLDICDQPAWAYQLGCGELDLGDLRDAVWAEECDDEMDQNFD